MKPATAFPAWAALVLALVAGLAAGAGAAFLGTPDPAAGATPSTTELASPGTTESAEAEASRSQLGREASTSEYERSARAILDAREQKYAAAARAMTREDRISHILSIAAASQGNFFETDFEKSLENQIQLLATIQPGDGPELLKLIMSGNLPLRPEQTEQLKNTVFQAMAREGNADFLGQMEGANEEMRQSMQVAYLQQVAERDPFEAITLLKSEAFEGAQENWQTMQLYVNAARVDVERALKLASEAGGSHWGQSQALSQVLQYVAGKDGVDKALEMSNTIKADGTRARVQAELLTRQAHLKREEILKSLEDPDKWSPYVRTNAISGIISSWAHMEPAAALDWGLENYPRLGLEDKSESDLQQIMQQFAAAQPKAALEKALSLPAEKRAPFVATAMESLAKGDPAVARAALEGLSAQDAKEALPKYVSGLAQRNPTEAAAYVETLPSGEGKAGALGNLVTAWVGIDLPAASQWLATQPAGKDRDAGAIQLINKIQREDPEAAALWTLQISEEKQRHSQMESTVRQWASRQKEDARAWVQGQSATLGPEQTTKLLQYVDEAKK